MLARFLTRLLALPLLAVTLHAQADGLPPAVLQALKAAQTVLQYTRRHPLTLYLVDNASPDGSGARLEAAVKGGALSTQPGQKVEVLFADESIDALDATCGGRPGCAAERLNAAGL